jgi:hypothetical protein
VDFHGSLEEFHLPDIIQFLSGAGKTGMLRLDSDQRRGSIFLLSGRIVHATCEDQSGEEAVYSLLALSSGKFDFEPELTAESETVRKNNTSLLVEAARRKDEWETFISKSVPGVDWIPEFVLPGSGDTGKQITLNTSEWVVLSKIDGRRSVRNIAKAANISIFQTAKLLCSLVSTELIKLREPGQ